MSINQLNEKHISALEQYKNQNGEIVRAGKIMFMAKDDATKTLMVHADPSMMPIAAPIDLLYADGAEIGGYLIVSSAGRMSFMPHDVFNVRHKPFSEPEIDLESADFSDALMWLKEGKSVARRGWNGKDQFVYLVKGEKLAAGLGYGFGESIGEPTFSDTFVLKNSQNNLVTWVPSIGDLLACDWCRLEDLTEE